MIVLLDEREVPLTERVYDDVLDAMPASRVCLRRVIVARRADDGGFVHLAYSGPDGWNGPRRERTRPYPFKVH